MEFMRDSYLGMGNDSDSIEIAEVLCGGIVNRIRTAFPPRDVALFV